MRIRSWVALALVAVIAGCQEPKQGTGPAPELRYLYSQIIERSGLYPRLKPVCITAMTLDKDDPTNLAKWSSEFGRGDSIVVALDRGAFDAVILQHWYPRPAIEMLQKSGAKVLLWAQVEALDYPWEGRADEYFVMYNMLAAHMLAGTNGQPINVYEGQGREAWAVNMLWPGVVDSLPQVMTWARERLGADGWFIDSVMDWDYFGTATNAPAPRNRHDAWVSFVARLRELDPDAVLWGNTVVASQPHAYGLDVMFAEQFFYGNSSVEAAVARLHDGLCLNTQRSDWHMHPERWRYLAHGAAMRGVRDLYACTACWDRYEPAWLWGSN